MSASRAPFLSIRGIIDAAMFPFCIRDAGRGGRIKGGPFVGPAYGELFKRFSATGTSRVRPNSPRYAD